MKHMYWTTLSAGRKDDTIGVHNKMKGLIAKLKEHTEEATGHEGH